MLVAYGITTEGDPVFLHLDGASAESTDACVAFLEDMVARGGAIPPGHSTMNQWKPPPKLYDERDILHRKHGTTLTSIITLMMLYPRPTNTPRWSLPRENRPVPSTWSATPRDATERCPAIPQLGCGAPAKSCTRTYGLPPHERRALLDGFAPNAPLRPASPEG